MKVITQGSCSPQLIIRREQCSHCRAGLEVSTSDIGSIGHSVVKGFRCPCCNETSVVKDAICKYGDVSDNHI
jgi:hypothetical protein